MAHSAVRTFARTVVLSIFAGVLAPSASNVLAAGAHAAKSPRYKVDSRIPLGGEGGWDMVTIDPDGQRLYVTHNLRVQVIDLSTEHVMGEIPDTPGPHGVAIAGDLGRGFVSNGRDSSVTVFDSRTLAVIGRVQLEAKNPDAIAYDPVSKRVFTFNGGSGNTTAIDAATSGIVGTLSLDGRPEFAVADGKGMIYANLEDKSEVVAFDTQKLQVVSRWPLKPGEEPTGLAIDRDHRRLFSGCANQKLVVLNADDGRIVQTLRIGKNVDAVAFDPARQLVFSSNGDGTLTVIHEKDPDHFKVIQTVSTQAGARTLALNPTTGSLYLPTAEFGPPPPPTADRPHPRGSVKPGTFVILVVRD
jgi:DNA-binding beta-propeller fold protein YncE